jgi:LEA14-like dessication related protein
MSKGRVAIGRCIGNPVIGLLLLLLLCSCATLDPDYEEPVISLVSLRALPSAGMTPSFETVLRVTNPNNEALNIAGVVYTISLGGHDLVKSVGKDFPVVEGYSEETLTLTGSANLLSGLRLLGDLMQQSETTLRYEFNAKLDLGGFYPSLRLSESGELDAASWQ